MEHFNRLSLIVLGFLLCELCPKEGREIRATHEVPDTRGIGCAPVLPIPICSDLYCLSTCSLTKPCKSSLYSKDSGQCQLLGRRLDTRGTQATHNTDNKMRYYVKVGGIHDGKRKEFCN